MIPYYVNTFFSPIRLWGRVLGVIMVASRRTESPIEYSVEKITVDNRSEFMDFLYYEEEKVKDVLTVEENEIIDALVDEASKIVLFLYYKAWDEYQDDDVWKFELDRGCYKDVVEKIENGGNLADVLVFSDWDFLEKLRAKEFIKARRKSKYEDKNRSAFCSRSYHGSVGIDEEHELQLYERYGRWGLMYRNGRIKLNAEYDEIKLAEDKSRGWHVRKGNLWGAVNAYGNKILPVEYDDIKEVSGIYYPDGHLLKKNGKWGYVDIVGHKVIDFIYDSLKVSDYDIACREGFLATKDGKVGFVEVDGTVLIDPVYDEITFCENRALILVRKGDKCEFLDYNGFNAGDGVGT